MHQAPPTQIVRTGEPYSGDIEIRVHGVSGTPPEELLDRATVERVSGDRIAGFYRPGISQVRRDIPRGMPPGDQRAVDYPWLEGYSWGGWTSGAKTRALWLVLTPFALVNVAPRMLPPAPAGDPTATRLRHATSALLRLLAATLTVTIVLGVTVPMLTTVGRRCAMPAPGSGSCHGIPDALTRWLADLSPAWQVAAPAAVPLLLVGLLWLLSRTSARRYESWSGPAPSTATRPDDDPIPLLRPDLWHGGIAVSRLRTLHLQIGLGTVLTAVAVLFPPSGLRGAAVGVDGLTLAAAVLLCLRRLPAGWDLRHRRIPLPATLVWCGVAAGFVLTGWLAAAGDVGADSASMAPDRLVSSADRWVSRLFELQGALLAVVALLLVTARVRGAGRCRSMFLSGYAALMFGVLAWLLASVVAAAVLITVPVWLGVDGFAFTPSRIVAMLQQHATWFGDTTRSSGFGMLVGVLTVVLLVAVTGVRAAVAAARGGTAADRARVRADYPGRDPTDPDVAARIRSIAFMYWTARLTDRVPRGIGVFTAVMIIVLLVQLVALIAGAARPGWLAFALGRGEVGATAIAWGVYLTGGLLIVLLLVGVLAYRTAAVRRGVGVLWDLACFWPREAHPFAPPCYNERVMPEVRTRLAFYVGSGDPVAAPSPARGQVVIAGHSQGSVISLAAVLIQRPEVAERVSLLTFGCVLDRLYSRFFPRYFSPEVYAAAADRLTGADGQVRWVNLWRRTDFLGGSMPYPPAPAPSGWPVDVRLTDPQFDREPGDIVYPTAGRHSGFWLDPEFQHQVHRLLATMQRARGAGPI